MGSTRQALAFDLNGHKLPCLFIFEGGAGGDAGERGLMYVEYLSLASNNVVKRRCANGGDGAKKEVNHSGQLPIRTKK